MTALEESVTVPSTRELWIWAKSDKASKPAKLVRASSRFKMTPSPQQQTAANLMTFCGVPKNDETLQCEGWESPGEGTQRDQRIVRIVAQDATDLQHFFIPATSTGRLE
ncbi:MAG: hypothetical protein ABI823_04650 [Bryobacteraceae bacterium]